MKTLIVPSYADRIIASIMQGDGMLFVSRDNAYYTTSPAWLDDNRLLVTHISVTLAVEATPASPCGIARFSTAKNAKMYVLAFFNTEVMDSYLSSDNFPNATKEVK